MYQVLKTISDLLSGKASIFVILTAVVTFFFPVLFEWVKGDTQTIILGIIMLTMGLTLTPDDFRLLAKRPLDILSGAAAQFTIMPLVAFSLSWLFSQVPAFAPYSTAMAIGIILVGCCHDMCLHFVGSRIDSFAGALARRRTCGCGCVGHV